MSPRQYVRQQEAVAFVAALFGFIAINAGEPVSAGIGFGAAIVVLAASILQIRVIGS